MNHPSRRALLAGIGMLGAATWPRRLGARAPRRFFGPGGETLGLQVYTLGGDALKDLDAAFAAVAKIGYRACAVSIGASIVAIGVGYALAPLFPLPVSFPARSLALIPTVGLVIGLVASVAGLRRAVRVDPVVAMGSAA